MPAERLPSPPAARSGAQPVPKLRTVRRRRNRQLFSFRGRGAELTRGGQRTSPGCENFRRERNGSARETPASAGPPGALWQVDRFAQERPPDSAAHWYRQRAGRALFRVRECRRRFLPSLNRTAPSALCPCSAERPANYVFKCARAVFRSLRSTAATPARNSLSACLRLGEGSCVRLGEDHAQPR